MQFPTFHLTLQPFELSISSAFRWLDIRIEHSLKNCDEIFLSFRADVHQYACDPYVQPSSWADNRSSRAKTKCELCPIESVFVFILSLRLKDIG